MSAPERPVTIRDLAAKCGVSIATISLALRNHPRISRETRERVQSIARLAGYRPNPMMAAHWETVRARKPSSFQSVIAVLTDWETSPRLTNDPWLSPAFRAMSERAARLGYSTEEFSLCRNGRVPEVAELRSCLRVLRNRGIYAVVVLFSAHPTLFTRNADLLEHFACALVCLESNYVEHSMEGTRRLPFHRTNPDPYGNMLLLLDQLRALGYRRPGFWPNSWAEARFAGESTAAFNFWIQSLPPRDRIPVNWTKWRVDPPKHVAREQFLKWLPRARPDVVIAQMLEVREWIESLRLSIPDDIGLVHTDLGPPEKGWSGIDTRLPLIASAGIDLVTAHLQRNERGIPDYSKDVRIEGEWVEGTTTRPVGEPSSGAA